MTHILGTTGLGELGGSAFAVTYTDSRLAPFFWYSKFEWGIKMDHLWPRSQYRGSEGRVATAPLNNAPDIWDWRRYSDVDGGMGQRRNIITGVTTNSAGAILGSCVVKLYETASDAVMDTGVVSDPTTGVYVATSPNSTSCYAVAYKAGSPDVAGTTVNTLTPA